MGCPKILLLLCNTDHFPNMTDEVDALFREMIGATRGTRHGSIRKTGCRSRSAQND